MIKMPIFKIGNKKLNRIRKTSFKLEKKLQNLVEKNLMEVFGLEFVRSEMQLKNLRIDTVAFDPETKSFVVIEYKRDKSSSVADQGIAYLALMVNNKGEFVAEYNENTANSIKRSDVDWSQSKVMFIADSFTPHQRAAIEFRDFPIELWTVNLFDILLAVETYNRNLAYIGEVTQFGIGISASIEYAKNLIGENKNED